jgi:hypothetical protein
MMSPEQFAEFEKLLQKSGVFAQPTALQQAMSILRTAPLAAARLLTYFAAKQELTEMKNELSRLQGCVRDMEAILEQQGPTACARSSATRSFVNWTVSFAESYYGLAAAFRVKQTMIPRVVGYLNGQHKKSAIFRFLDELASQPVKEGAIEAAVRQAFEQGTKNVPGFLKS